MITNDQMDYSKYAFPKEADLCATNIQITIRNGHFLTNREARNH